ncbi:MAG TPA: DUF4097 family beta strand repeat-containing protein [Candidatus Krumholzibacteria bacterium]|nr:DUF4097 family beta strand repeat-containing protein [Candidatus Krumholzibacteria bacterium]
MTGRLVSTIMVAAVALALAAPGAVAKKHGERYHEDIHESFDVGKSPRLTLNNVNGDVTITGADVAQIEVDVTKAAGSQERLEDVKVEFEQHGDHVSIEVDYDHGDHERWDNNDGASVEFTIRVPRGTRIDGVDLVNGDLSIEGVAGAVDAASVNGDVTGDGLAGDVDLSAVNGDVRLNATGPVGSIKLHSVNGTVELSVPKDASARVSASTLHGSIRGTGDIRAEKNYVGSSLSSVFGKGEGRISLDTVNGNIRIYRAGEAQAEED